ncbi:MurR/RpiR family transcriptional regulator [Lapidilactobacillus wuchangensis]|uniref:MurR/RpiR family transcriptional regulator n=1 Tax=Lapidilactobacillus wuchangensis TaxID=2486001 RepID=UPI000F766DC6|nr:MurR/RpiR family transcriptional regulator [Lapidilactobacillus wuchangensis]
MFHNIDLKTLSELELTVYNYIISHPKTVQNQTIRDLAKTTNVSTATINRFCQKLNLTGFPELKFMIRDELNTEQQTFPTYDISTPLTDFFTKVSRDEFEQQIASWLQMITAAKTLIYVGMGSSGYLAEYGARFMNNAGGYAFAQTDPFQPQILRDYDLSDTVVMILSVSGETERMLMRAGEYQRHHAKIIAITNREQSALSKVADLTISYYMPETSGQAAGKMTTQIPVVYLLETIAQRFAETSQDQ